MALVSASPELFLERQKQHISSSPIKGTGKTAQDLTEKDRAENVMIVDLVRNDLSQVCQTGSVNVPSLLETQVHPGLVHLVSKVEGELKKEVTWSEIFNATFPPELISFFHPIASANSEILAGSFAETFTPFDSKSCEIISMGSSTVPVSGAITTEPTCFR